ncbi:hypothetical protein HOLleu_21973 [Holothuria leucospilota]|uniref:Uncharacterized protein n=1 Tax=Holothuria leucospilota TaxID=206669 RepID=A0A9Q1BYN0_HOLLE|nr:hypothetical protein HOLleu_21973 [Holothuria leucospilota]
MAENQVCTSCSLIWSFVQILGALAGTAISIVLYFITCEENKLEAHCITIPGVVWAIIINVVLLVTGLLSMCAVCSENKLLVGWSFILNVLSTFFCVAWIVLSGIYVRDIDDAKKEELIDEFSILILVLFSSEMIICIILVCASWTFLLEEADRNEGY